MVSFKELAEYMAERLFALYVPVAEPNEGRPIQEIFNESLGLSLDDPIGEELRTYLEEQNYGVHLVSDANVGTGSPPLWRQSSLYWIPPEPDESYQQDWDQFVNRVTYRFRSLDRGSLTLLDRLVGGLDQQSWSGVGFPIRWLQPDDRVYRARVFSTEEEARDAMSSENLLGAMVPAPHEATKAGRLNHAGVRRFYGATSAELCMSEVRPPVGSYVIVAAFEPAASMPVPLFDFTRFDGALPIPNLFDEPIRRPDFHRRQFLASIHEHMTRPVLPSSEHIHYTKTQAVMEYLASIEDVVGIVTRSALGGGSNHVNITLFDGDNAVEGDPTCWPGTETIAAGDGSFGWSNRPKLRLLPNEAVLHYVTGYDVQTNTLGL